MKKADIYRNAGRNTAETANQGMQTANAAMPSGALPTNGAPMQGSAAAVIACIIIVFLVIRLLAGKTGDERRFTGIQPSMYNIGLITLAALVGGTILKVAAVKTLPPNNAMRALIVQGA